MGAGRPQLRRCGLLQEGTEEKHTHPVELSRDKGAAEGEGSRGMQEEGEAERERPKHLPAPLGV